MTTPSTPGAATGHAEGFLTRTRQQRATGFAILAVLVSLGLRAWGNAVEASEMYETSALDSIRTLEMCAWALSAVVLIYVALCLIALDRDETHP